MRPTRATATLASAFLVAGVAVLLLRRRGGEELKYQGRPIEHWFAQLPATVVSSQHVFRAVSMTAIGQCPVIGGWLRSLTFGVRHDREWQAF